MLDQLELLDTKAMQKLFGISKATLWRMVGDGELPKPVRLGRNVKWFKKSVDKTIDGMMAKSESNLAANRPRYRRRA